MTDRDLLNEYNYFRAHTHHAQKIPALKDLKPTPDRLSALKKMATFCGQNEVDPKLWLYMLFAQRRWIFAPQFHQLVPKDKRTLKKNLERYANLSEIPLFARRQTQKAQQVAEEQGRAFDANRDLDWTAEAIKRRYLNAGDAERCLEEMEIRTHGFHPSSLVCARCPLSDRCQELLFSKVGFDIVALRKGEMTSRQAQELAYRNGN